MGKRLFFWELAGFLWTALAGSALHFLYGWSGESLWAAPVSAVNESVWEHMKLLFVPAFLFTLVQLLFMGRQYPNLPAARGASMLLGLAVIPTAYYTYTGVFGVHLLWADLLIFVLASAAMFWLDHRLLRKGALGAGWQQLAGVVVLWALAFIFVWCTFRPPRLPLWRDPVSGAYGLARPFS